MGSHYKLAVQVRVYNYMACLTSGIDYRSFGQESYNTEQDNVGHAGTLQTTS